MSSVTYLPNGLDTLLDGLTILEWIACKCARYSWGNSAHTLVADVYGFPIIYIVANTVSPDPTATPALSARLLSAEALVENPSFEQIDSQIDSRVQWILSAEKGESCDATCQGMGTTCNVGAFMDQFSALNGTDFGLRLNSARHAESCAVSSLCSGGVGSLYFGASAPFWNGHSCYYNSIPYTGSDYCSAGTFENVYRFCPCDRGEKSLCEEDLKISSIVEKPDNFPDSTFTFTSPESSSSGRFLMGSNSSSIGSVQIEAVVNPNGLHLYFNFYSDSSCADLNTVQEMASVSGGWCRRGENHDFVWTEYELFAPSLHGLVRKEFINAVPHSSNNSSLYLPREGDSPPGIVSYSLVRPLHQCQPFEDDSRTLPAFAVLDSCWTNGQSVKGFLRFFSNPRCDGSPKWQGTLVLGPTAAQYDAEAGISFYLACEH